MSAQFLRPDTDAAIGSWSDNAGGGSNIYLSIDESSPSDADYIRSNVFPENSAYKARLSNPPSALVSPVTIRYRLAKEGTQDIDYRVRLLQGATEIAVWDSTATSTTPATISQTLTAPQIASITDWNDLFVEIIAGYETLPDINDWLRPSDWLPMPATIEGYMDILVPVFPDGPNDLTVRMAMASSGTMNIDWGDGTIDTGLTHNTDYTHLYDYTDFAGTECARGYRQAICRVYRTSGAENVERVYIGYNSTYANGDAPKKALDVQVNCPGITDCGLAFQDCGLMERCVFQNTVSFTSLNNTFRTCRSLKSVIFNGSAPLAAITDFREVFRDCRSLENIVFPSGSLSLVTLADSVFADCHCLSRLSLPANALAAVTSIDSGFYSCRSLSDFAFPSGALVTGTVNADNLLNACAGLFKVTFPTGVLAGAGISVGSILVNIRNLNQLVNCKFPDSFSLEGNMLSSAALDEIYTSLPTVSAKTITVTGCYGNTGDTPSIATGKGWTVTS
jgi:hypothetical protein